MKSGRARTTELLVLLGSCLAALVLSGIRPYDRVTWFLEVAPVLIGIPIEWWSAVLGGEAAESFLGTQGDVWDTQWDMFLALLGTIAAQLLLGRIHERQLERRPSGDASTSTTADGILYLE